MKSILLATAALATAAHDFKSCPGAKGTLHVTTLTLNPDPPKLGSAVAVEFKGGPVTADIAGGKAALEISLHGVHITTADFDFCTQLGVTCPVKKGDNFDAKLSYNLPSAPIPSYLTIKVDSTFTNAAGVELDCYTLDTHLGDQVQEAAVFNGSLPEATARYLFANWRAQYPHVTIEVAEEETRFAIFKSNFETIISHNMKKKSDDDDYTMGMNEFGHLTWREFKRMYVGGARSDLESNEPRQQHLIPSNFTAPKGGVDWSKKGAVTPIKNQGQCGSCWAFSTTGSLEGAYFLKTGELKSFSEQQLVDCDKKQDQGCNGGLMDNAFDFIKTNKGLCTEEAYPYKGVDGTCKKKCKDDSKATVKTHTDVAANAKALMSAIAKQPVSIAIEADQSSFQFYKSGVFTAACGTTLDHGVLAVGYGTMGKKNATEVDTKKKAKNYWKVKNSWGASWGMNGFILLERGKKQKGGQCGILNSASYPTLV